MLPFSLAATILAAARLSSSGPATGEPPYYITTISPSARAASFASTFATRGGYGRRPFMAVESTPGQMFTGITGEHGNLSV